MIWYSKDTHTHSNDVANKVDLYLVNKQDNSTMMMNLWVLLGDARNMIGILEEDIGCMLRKGEQNIHQIKKYIVHYSELNEAYVVIWEEHSSMNWFVKLAFPKVNNGTMFEYLERTKRVDKSL